MIGSAEAVNTGADYHIGRLLDFGHGALL